MSAEVKSADNLSSKPFVAFSSEALHEAQQPFHFAFSPQPAPLSPGSQREVERALSRGLSVSSVRLPLCEGQDLPSSKAVTSEEGVVVREHVATYAQAHGRALDVWQREWAARKLVAARARRASSPALPLPSLCRSPAASPVLGQPATTTRRSSRLMVGVPHAAASPAPPPELVLLPPATCPESAGGLLPEESEVDTVFLDHVLDFLKADEDPPPFAVTSDSSSTSSSDSSSTSDESPSTAAQAGRALSHHYKPKHMIRLVDLRID